MIAFAFFGAMALQYRWVYLSTNLQVKENVDKAIAVIHRAKLAGYNGIVLSDSKLQRLDSVPDWYFTNTKAVLDVANKDGMDVIPCTCPVGYAESMLSHDVNLVEGLPFRDALFEVHQNELRQVNEAGSEIKNGGFEEFSNGRFSGFDFADDSAKKDSEIKHGGTAAVRFDDFRKANEYGNGRIVQTVQVKPWRQYRVTVWAKTEALQGESHAMALDSEGKMLSIVAGDLPPTQDWKPLRFTFNSQKNEQAKLYFGTWGGRGGKIWWDDASIEECDFLNLIRRPGCPVKTSISVDLDSFKDPGLGVNPWPGAYEVDHDPPHVATDLKEGTRIRVSGFNATLGIGNQAAICLSEPATKRVIEEEINRISKLYNPKGFFLSHDEIRVGGWCDACSKSGLSSGQILAANVAQVCAFAKKAKPGADLFVWSDMFDPNHNAVDGYYLTNGSLKGSWEGLPKEAVIVNWNSEKRVPSMEFFAQRGNRQILAGYYDGPVDAITDWLKDARKVEGISGVMYTTWVGDYSNLEKFAEACGFGK